MTLVKHDQIFQYSTKLIITWIIVSLVFRNVLIRTAVLFSEILWLWLNMIKFCQHSTKLIITWIIVSLVFKNVLIRTAVLFSEILWLWLIVQELFLKFQKCAICNGIHWNLVKVTKWHFVCEKTFFGVLEMHYSYVSAGPWFYPFDLRIALSMCCLSWFRTFAFCIEISLIVARMTVPLVSFV